MLSNADKIIVFIGVLVFWFSLNLLHFFDSSSTVEHSKFTHIINAVVNMYIYRRFAVLIRETEKKRENVYSFLSGFRWVCAHTHVAKLLNLWTCFANDVNDSMQVVNCLFRTSYDIGTLLFLRYFDLCRTPAFMPPCTASILQMKMILFFSKNKRMEKNQRCLKMNEIVRVG